MYFICLVKRMKSLLVDYTCIFWTFLFPIILVILFSLTLPEQRQEKFVPINVSLVGSAKYDAVLFQGMTLAGNSDGEKIFRVSLSSRVMADEKLSSHDIDVYIYKESGYKVVCNEENSNTQIVKTFLEYYEQAKGYGSLSFDMNYAMKEYTSKDFNRNDIYFLSLLALAAFMAMHWGIRISTDVEADQSGVAARIMISPVAKWKITLQNLLVVFFLEFLFNMLELFLVITIRGMHLLAVFPYITIVQMLTSLVAFLTGVFFCVLIRAGYDLKRKICERLIFLAGFFGGIMFYNIRFEMNDRFPILSRINPVNIATDAMYHLYFVKNMQLYIQDILILCGMVVVLTGTGIYLTRRKIYERM